MVLIFSSVNPYIAEFELLTITKNKFHVVECQ